MVLLQRKLYFSKDPEGWGELRSQMLISIETHVTCDFPGGSRPPIPPLDLIMVHILLFVYVFRCLIYLHFCVYRR